MFKKLLLTAAIIIASASGAQAGTSFFFGLFGPPVYAEPVYYAPVSYVRYAEPVRYRYYAPRPHYRPAPPRHWDRGHDRHRGGRH